MNTFSWRQVEPTFLHFTKQNLFPPPLPPLDPSTTLNAPFRVAARFGLLDHNPRYLELDFFIASQWGVHLRFIWEPYVPRVLKRVDLIALIFHSYRLDWVPPMVLDWQGILEHRIPYLLDLRLNTILLYHYRFDSFWLKKV